MVTAPFAAEFSGLPPQPQAVLENGRVVVFLETRSPGIGSHGVPERQPLLVALHQDGGGWDSVRVEPGTERVFGPAGEGGGVPTYTYQFGGYTVAAGAGATLAVADAARFRIELFDAEGRLVSILWRGVA